MAYVTTLFLVLACSFLPAHTQQGTFTPAPGTSERTVILHAVRPLLEAQLKQPIRFRVNHLRVQGRWAFLEAQPQRRDGKPIQYRATPYQSAVEAGAFDESVHVLLRKQGRVWTVVVFNLGATDVVWEPWPKQYGAPRAIFPHGDS